MMAMEVDTEATFKIPDADKKSFIIYPEDVAKAYWDIVISLILVTSCILTPYQLALA